MTTSVPLAVGGTALRRCGVCRKRLTSRKQKYCTTGNCRSTAFRQKMYAKGYVRTRQGWKKKPDEGGELTDRLSA